jgi:hypothetical protein
MTTPQQRKITMAGVGVVAFGCLVAAVVSGGSNSDATTPVTTVVTDVSIVDIAPVTDESTTTIVATDSSLPTDEIQDLAGDDPSSTKACTLTVRSLASGDTGESVTCLTNTGDL